MANQIIDRAFAHLAKLNLISCERVAKTVTTGSTGNVALGDLNDGRTACVGGHISGSNGYVRLWVAESNNTWFATVVDANTGNTINNKQIALRYWRLKFTSDTKLGGGKTYSFIPRAYAQVAA